jgi:hypothetical protein|tara:strand:- start:338 stop:592 length:255 start_codon:yes stop_codon:yes gene_type:complete
MADKIYRLYGIDVAMELLRPKAKYEISNNVFTRWEDPRPCPTIEEVYKVMELSKDFEDKIDTQWLPEQVKELEEEDEKFRRAMH